MSRHSTGSTATGTTQATAEAGPFLTVVAGNPTAEEVAALTAVIAGLGAVPAPAPVLPPPHRTWARRRMLSLSPKPGPGSWRRSFR